MTKEGFFLQGHGEAYGLSVWQDEIVWVVNKGIAFVALCEETSLQDLPINQRLVSYFIFFSLHRYGATLCTEEFEYLIDLIEAKCGLALLEFTHEA